MNTQCAPPIPSRSHPQIPPKPPPLPSQPPPAPDKSSLIGVVFKNNADVSGNNARCFYKQRRCVNFPCRTEKKPARPQQIPVPILPPKETVPAAPPPHPRPSRARIIYIMYKAPVSAPSHKKTPPPAKNFPEHLAGIGKVRTFALDFREKPGSQPGHAAAALRRGVAGRCENGSLTDCEHTRQRPSLVGRGASEDTRHQVNSTEGYTRKGGEGLAGQTTK